jgi:hypothetical protein
MTDDANAPRYFVLRQEDNETWKLITQLMEPVEAASREEAIVKATEGLDAKEQNGAFLVLSEDEYAPINRTMQPTTIEEFHGPSYPRSGKAGTTTPATPHAYLGLRYAKRRGRWPSALSARLFARLLGKRNRVAHLAATPRASETVAP